MQTKPADPNVVTFLFTDVEGSTRLAERFPNEAAEILARHHALIAEVAERRGGRVFERVGDAAIQLSRRPGRRDRQSRKGDFAGR